MIRTIQQKSDLDKVKEIHSKFYQEEFPFPNLSEFISFMISENSGNIVAFGGLRFISELIFITDLEASQFSRYKCLNELLVACKTLTKQSGKDQAYAMAEGSEWVRTLKRVGFEQFKAVPLVINVE